MHGADGLAKLTNIKDVSNMIGFALFLLLSLRNQSAYARWYDGAEKFQATVGEIKEIARRIAVNAIADHPTEAKEMLWWLVAALECMKTELRGSTDITYLYTVLPEDMVKGLNTAPDKVQYALYRYGVKAFTGDLMSKSKGLWSEPSRQLYTYYQSCYRIRWTPFPFSYIAHLRSLLFIWLSLLPWYLAPIYDWYMLILTCIIGYAIIGVEDAASEVEQPFGADFNDLPLDEMAENGYQALEMYLDIAKARERELNLVSSAKSETKAFVDDNKLNGKEPRECPV
jgi:putative membrane protein